VEAVDRLFVAAPVPDEVRLALSHELSELDIPGRKTPPGNWHVTLRFLGDVDRVTYERFLAEFERVTDVAPFIVGLNGIDAFPRPSKATVLWVSLDRGEPELGVINEIAEDASQSVGLMPEDRPFRPHLTLSRIRPPRDVRHLVSEQLDLSWRCNSVIVYRSILQRGGATYEPLETFALSR